MNMEVAIWMVAYNHQDFVARAIESVLKQQTDFRYKLFIGEDYSTDNTRSICIEYAKMHPDIIELILHEKNVGPTANAQAVYRACFNSEASFVAMCEGDDYWIDPNKLQKQVDFLRANSDYSLVSGGFMEVDENGSEGQMRVHKLPTGEKMLGNGFVITKEIFARQWYVNTFTITFRKEWIDFEAFKKYEAIKDTHLFYYLIQKGPGYYLLDVLAAYRKHSGGVFSAIGRAAQLSQLYKDYSQLYRYHPIDFEIKYKRILIDILRLPADVFHKSLPKRAAVQRKLFSMVKTENDFFELCSFVGVKNPRLISLSLRLLRLFGKVR